MDRSIDDIRDEALKAIESAEDRQGIEAVSTRFLGRKGLITQFLRNISNLPEEDRPVAGKRANQVKGLLQEAITKALDTIDSKGGETIDIDVSLPGREQKRWDSCA